MNEFLNVQNYKSPEFTTWGVYLFVQKRREAKKLTNNKECFIGGFGGKIFNTMIINKLT